MMKSLLTVHPSIHPSTPPILLSGYYGFGNAGDEAILQATVEGLRRRGYANIAVLSSDPTTTTRLWSVPAFHRYRLRQFWGQMRPGGLLLSGGGGLFQDTTSRRSLVYYLGILLLARARGMKTMVYAQGLGPLHRRSSRLAVRWVLRRVDRITFRDEASAGLLGEIGLPGRAVVTADPAFTLEPSTPECAREILVREGVPDGVPLLAAAVRPWGPFGEEGRRLLASALDEAAVRHGAHILFVNMHERYDRAAAAALASKLSTPHTIMSESCTPSELAGILGQCQALAAMRLHALILGSLSGLPAVALTYDPKVDAAARQLGFPAMDVLHLEGEPLNQALQVALAADPSSREHIQAAARQQQWLAEENFRIIDEIMSG